MDAISKPEIKNLLKKYKIRPSKRLGQNFLIDRGIIKKIIEAAELSLEDIILEIGPGLGNLTKELAKKAKKVIAVEKDQKMIKILEEVLKDHNNVKIIQGDILKFNLLNSRQIPKNYKIVANIPYYLTSPLIRKFLETKNQPKEMILMVQKEVAERICAQPPKMNLLAVSVQFYAKAKIISFVSKKSFWPRPKVDSAIIKITPKTNRGRLSTDLFFKIVKAGFSHPRKQILNNFSEKLKWNKGKVRSWLLKNKIKVNQRAETLTLEDWFNLTQTYD